MSNPVTTQPPSPGATVRALNRVIELAVELNKLEDQMAGMPQEAQRDAGYAEGHEKLTNQLLQACADVQTAASSPTHFTLAFSPEQMMVAHKNLKSKLEAQGFQIFPLSVILPLTAEDFFLQQLAHHNREYEELQKTPEYKAMTSFKD